MIPLGKKLLDHVRIMEKVENASNLLSENPTPIFYRDVVSGGTV